MKIAELKGSPQNQLRAAVALKDLKGKVFVGWELVGAIFYKHL